MGNLFKMALSVGGALLVGLLLGLLIGFSGKGELEQKAAGAQKRAEDAEQVLADEQKRCSDKLARAKQRRSLSRAKEHLLRALIELYASNYGLANGHIEKGAASLRKMRGVGSQNRRKRVKEVLERLRGVQSVVMRLDPTAQGFVQDLLAQLERLSRAG